MPGGWVALLTGQGPGVWDPGWGLPLGPGKLGGQWGGRVPLKAASGAGACGAPGGPACGTCSPPAPHPVQGPLCLPVHRLGGCPNPPADWLHPGLVLRGLEPFEALGGPLLSTCCELL